MGSFKRLADLRIESEKRGDVTELNPEGDTDRDSQDRQTHRHTHTSSEGTVSQQQKCPR